MPGYQGGFNGSTLPEVLDYITRLDRTMTYLMGQLDTENIREIGGWRIEPGVIRSKDYDVGMSTDDTLTDNVRFWAGGIDPNSSLWRVYQSGKGVATGWTVQSKGGIYPRIVMDPEDDLLGAYSSASNFISIRASDPSISGFSPSLNFENGIGHATAYMDSGGALEVLSSDGIGLDGGAVGIYLSGMVRVVGGFDSLTDGTTNLQAIINNLQSQIDNKANISHTHTVSIPDHNHGNPDNANSGGGTFTVS